MDIKFMMFQFLEFCHMKITSQAMQHINTVKCIQLQNTFDGRI